MWALTALMLVRLGDAPGEAATPAGPVNASLPSTESEVWIRHPRLPAEPLVAIASRYDVTVAQLEAWNPGIGAKAAKGEKVRVLVDGDRPALHPVYARVHDRDDWSKVATRYDVTAEALRAANPQFAKRKRPPPGARLTVWVASGVQRLPAAAPPQPLPTYEVTPGGFAVGPPHRGRLEGGVKLPDSELYTLRFDKLAYGTSLAVADIQRAIAAFRRETGYDGELFIGALSRKKGRRLPPHRSHRTGRDVDIRLPALAHAEGYKLERDEVDWPATWALIDAFVRTGDVQMIFLERKLWSRLRRAALRTGATDGELDRAFDLIKHSKGHTGHIHVRFQCSPDAPDCKP